MAILGSHPGSWGGLPDFGITEAVGKLLGSPQTSQGGSNILQPNQQAGVSGALGGASGFGIGSGGQNAITSPSGGGGGSAPVVNTGGTGNGNGGSKGSVLGAGTSNNTPNAGQNTTFQQPSQANVDYNAIYQPAMEALQQALGSVNQQYTAQEANINSQAQGAQSALDTDLQGQQQQIGQAKTTQTTQTGNAMNQARQAYNEISQGIQAKYGGTTGTGAFANEIAGRQTGNNLAQFQTNLTNALGGLDQASQHVQLVHDQNIKDLQAQTESAIQSAKSTLQNNIAQIGMQQGQVQSAKAQQIANAVINYQQTVNQVSAMQTQYAQQLQIQQNQIQGQLAYARQLGGNYLSNGVNNATGLLKNTQNTQTTTPVGGTPGLQSSSALAQNTGQGQIQFPQIIQSNNQAPIQQLGSNLG